MQIKTFIIPVPDAEESEAVANKFLRSHRILTVDRAYDPVRGWALFVQYQDNPSGLDPALRKDARDFSKELSAEAYLRFSRLKGIRKEIAREKGVPAYLIFTNEELSVLAREENLTSETLLRITQIPRKRLDDYGDLFVAKMEENAQDITLDGENLPD